MFALFSLVFSSCLLHNVTCLTNVLYAIDRHCVADANAKADAHSSKLSFRMFILIGNRTLRVTKGWKETSGTPRRSSKWIRPLCQAATPKRIQIMTQAVTEGQAVMASGRLVYSSD